jgi:hypothetical protein
MNANKLLRILILIAGTLAFLVVAVVLIRRPKPLAAPFAGHLDSAEKIRLQRAGRDVLLWHKGSEWEVSAGDSAVRYRADVAKVKALTDSLKALELEDVISERPENAADFEVNIQSAMVVSLLSKTNAIVSAVAIGKQAPDFMHVYARRMDRPEVYLARGVQSPSVLGTPDVLYWRDLTLWDFPEDQVMTVFIQGPDFKTALARSSDTWTLDGRKINPAPVWGMLGVLAHLKAEGFLAVTPAPAMNYASVTVQLKDGRTRRLQIGRRDPQTQSYLVAMDADPTVFEVSSKNIGAVLIRPSAFTPPKK